MALSKELRAYMSRIGTKGGEAGKGSPARRAAAKLAAKARWANHKKAKQP